ncbi:MAG: hybrid sensor histidine kinase/response regulator [Myxococcota bacterium]
MDEEIGQVAPELLEAFWLESEDHLRVIATQLRVLDGNYESRDAIQSVRRSVHTLKGAAGVVGFHAISNLAHRMEDLLDELYEGNTKLTSPMLELLFRTSDTLDDLSGGKTDRDSLQPVLQRLYQQYDAMMAGEDVPSVPIPPLAREPIAADAPKSFEPIAAEAINVEAMDLRGEAEGPESRPARPAAATETLTSAVVRVPIERLDELVRLVSELVIARTAFEQRMNVFATEISELKPSTDRLKRVSGKLEREYEVVALGGGGRHFAPDHETEAKAGGSGVQAFLDESARGWDELEFDRYTDFHMATRELAETTSDIGTVGNSLFNLIGDFGTLLGREGRLASELQDKLMRIRMVPLASLATRLHRTVRVVANKQSKLAQLVIEGQELDLDKTVLEEIADPLLHLLRNAVDHGLEAPALRRVTGKPERGTIYLKAYYEGTQVVIQVADDGQGIDLEVLRTAAVDKGYVSAADADELSRDDLYNLIFAPGFSTAATISDVSGRGVGMDVVRSNINKLKGTVALDSEIGKGTSFTIRLPRSLAITQALIVKANGQQFALPLTSIAQITRVRLSEVERLGDNPVIRVEDNVYPLSKLADLLHLSQPLDEPPDRVPVLILKAGNQRIALSVDEIVAGREIVVKPLGSHLRRVHGLAGATLMGDGSVVLILNPPDLVSDAPERRARTWAKIDSDTSSDREDWKIMVVDDSLSVRRVMANMVQGAGWTPITAKDGVDALEILQGLERLPELILMDIEMPRMDGYELTRTLKAHSSYSTVPIVMVTSRAGEKHRRKAAELGVSDYVVKPFQSEELCEKVRSLVRKSSASKSA